MPRLNNTHFSAERVAQNLRYIAMIDLVDVYYPLNKVNFRFLEKSAFNRLSSAARWNEVNRVVTAFNSPWPEDSKENPGHSCDVRGLSRFPRNCGT